jgi:hypothetical protein
VLCCWGVILIGEGRTGEFRQSYINSLYHNMNNNSLQSQARIPFLQAIICCYLSLAFPVHLESVIVLSVCLEDRGSTEEYHLLGYDAV